MLDRLATFRPLVLACTLLLGLVAGTPPAQALAAGDDSPPVPTLQWGSCGSGAPPGLQCALASVPLDYQHPHGATITIALDRFPATDPAHRIGSLFTNPGGPGGSGVQALPFFQQILPADVLARFDLIGFDPRGIGSSTQFDCFANGADEAAFLQNVPPFPVGPTEIATWIQTWERFDTLCAQQSPNLLPHMSTANAARDMDLLRRAVGDPKLTYLGDSYGTYLGATYVNLFPNRVRSVMLDGVLEPVEWATGRGDESETLPFATRLRSDQGSFATLGQFLDLCAAGGTATCAFAAPTAKATHDKFDDLLRNLLASPLVVPTGPGQTVTITYADVVSTTRGALYQPQIWPQLAAFLQQVDQLAGGPELLALRQALTPYANGLDALYGVACADTDNPQSPFAWPIAAREADERAPYFGADWTFLSQGCARWATKDAARFTGPWNHRTSNTVLVVGNLYDPATRYQSAVSLSHELVNARLLTVDGWGHTSLLAGSSCALGFEATYLISGQVPPAGTACPVDHVPFSATPATAAPTAADQAAQALVRSMLPRVP